MSEDYPAYVHKGCLTCSGEGLIVICVDDICHGIGECIHGESGMANCRDCKGTGDAPEEDEDGDV